MDHQLIDLHAAQCVRKKDNVGCPLDGCRYGTEPYPGYMRNETPSYECLLLGFLWRVTATYELYTETKE